MSNKKEHHGFTTRSVHAGEETDCREGATGDVVSPIHLSTTFVWKSPGLPLSEFEYIRSQNPTRKVFETKLAALENAAYGIAFSSGLAAESAIMQAFLAPGDHVVVFDDIYGGTRRLLDEVFHGLEVSYVDLSDTSAFEKALNSRTKLLWIESPTNPMLKICDIPALSALARKNRVIVVVDNTFLSPYFQQPLKLGADLVVHSTTKYIGGHSDALGGAVLTSDEGYYEKVRGIQNNVGAVLSPFDSYLNIRGLKTLALRMEQHQKNALAVVRFLAGHPKVKRVYYPGLEHHPNHEVLRRQASGFGGMVSFETEGDIETAKTFLGRLKLFALAESLGGVESLIELPALMTHVSVDQAAREKVGITDTLVRASIGIEDVDDLIADLKQALG